MRTVSQKNDGPGLLIPADKADIIAPDPSPKRSAGLDANADMAGDGLPVAALNHMNDGEEGQASACADQPDEVIEFAARTMRAVQLKQDGEEDRRENAAKAGAPLPSSPSPQRSTGQSRFADKAGLDVPVAAPRNKPGHARRGAAAIASVQPVVAKSLFDTYRLPGDDRAIGDISWKELQHLARKHAEAYRLLALIDGYGQPTNTDAMVRDVIKESTLKEFVEIARLANAH